MFPKSIQCSWTFIHLMIHIDVFLLAFHVTPTLSDIYNIYPSQDAFKKHVEHIQKKSRRSKVHVAQGYYSKENMKKKLGWDPLGPYLWWSRLELPIMTFLFMIEIWDHVSPGNAFGELWPTAPSRPGWRHSPGQYMRREYNIMPCFWDPWRLPCIYAIFFGV